MRRIQSIQLLKNNEGIIYLVPYIINELGLNSELNTSIKMDSLTTVEEIGKKVKTSAIDSIKIDIIYTKDEVKVWQLISGIKNRKRFCSEWERVFVYYNPNNEIVYGIPSGFEVSSDKFDGQDLLGTNYMPRYNLPLGVSDEELGKTILEAFSQIKDIVLRGSNYNFES